MPPFLQATLFIVGFVIFLIGFITFIGRLSRRLNHRINPRTHGVIEALVIAGIALGIIGMFQPFTKALYEPGFLLLLISTLGFIVWSHVVPATRAQMSAAAALSALSATEGAK